MFFITGNAVIKLIFKSLFMMTNKIPLSPDNTHGLNSLQLKRNKACKKLVMELFISFNKQFNPIKFLKHFINDNCSPTVLLINTQVLSLALCHVNIYILHVLY